MGKSKPNVPKRVEVRVRIHTWYGKAIEVTFDRVTRFELKQRRDVKQLRPRKGDTVKRYKATPTSTLVLRVAGRRRAWLVED